ncbi:Nuclear factor NF-kappa-B p100 subunit [Geodia barretti]|nr:Nuclear factor NF-kappa-B p100 subunit [Geodia barretti]
MEEGETHRTVVSPSHHTSSGGGGGGGGPVNFRSIEELSRSDRQPDSMEVEQQRNPHMAKVMSLIRSSRESANFSSRHSPQSLRAVSPSSSSINSLNSARSVSPHSPRSPHTSLTQPNSGGSGSSGAGGDAEGRRQRVAGGGEEGGGREEEAEVKRQSALLQVSEAHLAILPDEDGDTPLHLSIIHENVRLTQHLVKLIVGVYMNLDIANNMRQTPLHLAIITRQPHIVQMLVQAGASVNFPDRKGNTALHLAAARRDMQVLKILARAASPVPDFNCKNFAGCLQWAYLSSLCCGSRELYPCQFSPGGWLQR